MNALVLKSEAQNFSNLSTEVKVKTLIEDAKSIILTEGYNLNFLYPEIVKHVKDNKEYDEAFNKMTKTYSVNYNAVETVCKLLKEGGCKLAYIATMFLDGILHSVDDNDIENIIRKYIIGDNTTQATKTEEKPKAEKKEESKPKAEPQSKVEKEEEVKNETPHINKVFSAASIAEKFNPEKQPVQKPVQQLVQKPAQQPVQQQPLSLQQKAEILKQHIIKHDNQKLDLKEHQVNNLLGFFTHPIVMDQLRRCQYDGDLKNIQLRLLNGDKNVIYKLEDDYDMLFSAKTTLQNMILLIKFNTDTNVMQIVPIERTKVYAAKKNNKKNK